MRLWTAYDRELSQKMTTSMIAFAKTGNPQTAEIRWPARSAANEQLIEIGDNAIIAQPMNKARIEFMAQPVATMLPPVAPRGLPGQPRD